jgi:PAS domain S-box-containing protein
MLGGNDVTPLDDEGLAGESFFESLIESSLDSVKVLDPDGRLLYLNRVGMESMEVADFAQLKGVLWWLLWPAEYRDQVRAAVEAARVGEVTRFRASSATASGSLKTWDVVVSPQRTSAGSVTRIVCTSRDITEATDIRAEKGELDLQRSLAVLRSAHRIAKIGGWETDYLTNRVVFTDEIWTMLGRPSRPYVSMEESLTYWAHESRAPMAEAVGRAKGFGELLIFEGEALTGTGDRIWLRLFGEPVFEGGACVALRGAIQDVTAEHAARARLEESERFVRGIIDGMGDMITVLDERGVVVAANQAWIEFRKTNPHSLSSDALGLDFLAGCRQVLGRPGQKLAASLDTVLTGEQATFEAEYPFHAPTRQRWVKLSAYRIPGAGPIRVVVMQQDITELKLSEQRLERANLVLKAATRAAESASEAKSAFLAAMSHEIRTPLNGVLGMAQAMAHDELTPAQRERLDVIRQSGEALLVLLNDVLDLSKVEAGKLDLEDGVVDVEQMAAGALASLGTFAVGKDLRFGVEVAPSARGCWRGDPNRVRQVLYNLISNALKFTERGSVQVEISHDGRDLILRVADTGPGIPAATRDKLFQKFVQADASTTRRYGGSGLGLAICRELVQLMGGQIAVDSVVGAGSTFFVSLPLSRIDAPAAAPSEAPPQIRANRTLRVLAAEDNPMNVLVLKTLLQQISVELYVVTNGVEAVAAWEDGVWDIILMDVQMPVMDGPTAARRIREREKSLGRPRTPIVALTANAMAHHKVEYADAGMDALTSKPIDFRRLLATMDSLLGVAEDVVPPRGRLRMTPAGTPPPRSSPHD